MKTLAEALIYAVVYLDLRPDPTEEVLDDDVGALESIAGTLVNATDEEKDALADAATRLRDEEASGSNREEFVESYSSWMEDMFGDEDWDGNARRP